MGRKREEERGQEVMQVKEDLAKAATWKDAAEIVHRAPRHVTLADGIAAIYVGNTSDNLDAYDVYKSLVERLGPPPGGLNFG